MKRIVFGFWLIVVWISPALSANESSSDGTDDTDRREAREFVQKLKAYADSMPPFFDEDMHPFGKAEVVFHLEKENFDRSIKPSRVAIQYGAVEIGFPSPFAPLKKFFQSLDRLSNIEFDGGGKYKMRLPEAILVPSGTRVSQWRGDVSVQFWEQVPWVIEIEASAPHKRGDLRAIKVIYIWNHAEFREYGMVDYYWVPAQVIVFARERRGETIVDLRQKWTLEKIVAIEEASARVEVE